MVMQPFNCNASILPEGTYAVAQSTISLHGAISSTTWSRFTISLFDKWGMFLSCYVQLKLALLFSPNCSYSFPVGLLYLLGMGGVSGRDGKEMMVLGRVVVADKCLIS